jgi:hypothetical protein
MHTRLGHDHAREGMPDQNRRAILPRQHALGRRDRFGERRQRVLHGRDVEPGRLQTRDHFGPARSIGEQSVHEHDVARGRAGRVGGEAAGGDQQGSRTGNQGRRKSTSGQHDESPSQS